LLLPDEAVEKSAARARGVPEPDEVPLKPLTAAAAADESEPCRPGAAPSEAQSFAAAELAVAQQAPARQALLPPVRLVPSAKRGELVAQSLQTWPVLSSRCRQELPPALVDAVLAVEQQEVSPLLSDVAAAL
jgi:hypothetical protein